MRDPLRPAVLALGCLLGILPSGAHAQDFEPDFEPGEFVWFASDQRFDEALKRKDSEANTNSFYCPECAGYYSEERASHLHYWQSPDEIPAVSFTPLQEENRTETPSLLSRLWERAKMEMSRLRSYLDEALAVCGGILALLLAVRLLILPLFRSLRRRTPARRALPFRNGVPQGTEVLPGRLVCAPEGVFDGGTANGYFAMFLAEDGRWIPAFVKRAMSGRSLKEDQLLPALRFEADVLRRLEGTNAVPRLLVPPRDKVPVGGEAWSFYAMSFAAGEPWPERGGLGRRTRPALHALCEALEQMHERGIGHHDLKPQNIHWGARRKAVTLLDLGSAIDHAGALRNPLASTYPKSVPWVAPERDGRRLADLSTASDVWVYGLLFCEAVAGGIHPSEGGRRRWPERPEDRQWIRERVGAATSPAVADAVVDGLLAPQASERMPLRDFRAILEREWEEDL